MLILSKFCKDITNHRFGKLIARFPVERKKGRIYWNCVCDCGKEKIAKASNLLKGVTKSCGCLQIQHAKLFSKLQPKPRDLEEHIRCTTIKQFIQKAKARNIAIALDESTIIELSNSNCYYCNSPPSNAYRIRRKEASKFLYQGIDRLDHTKGYEPENVVPCCKLCNMAKHILNQHEFFELVLSIYENLKSKGIYK